ncbi:MAG: hypothetical protein CMK89_04990 [Pseudomonadales bacterium]|nr:hypothetical protein [Pseudomonadales bacterium]
MSSRVLSAYFDDFRKGKRQREELRLFMEDAIRKEPMRRGHFMAWLDQAQYEHPIPVTEFLLLRKEIEASLDNDDQTRIALPKGPVKTSPDAETLVAGNEEETLVAPGEKDEDATEVSSGSQPSDMARLHAAATMIAKPEELHKQEDEKPDNKRKALEQTEAQDDATIVSTTHASMVATQRSANPQPEERRHSETAQAKPEPTEKQDKAALPVWLWLSAGILVIALGFGYWAIRPASNVIVVEPVPPSEAVNSVEALARELVDKSEVVDKRQLVGEADISADSDGAAPVAAAPVADSAPAKPIEPLPADLSPQQAIATLLQRVSAGELLPLEQTGNAQEVMDYMLAHYPEAPESLEARQILKDAYLAASKRAQGQGEWDQSQILLDAAFNVLSATAH